MRTINYNTHFEYMYRDAANYKYFEDVVIKGNITIEDLKPFLHDYDYFIPSEVGLYDLQPEPLTVFDHIWHEIFSITPTDRLPTCTIDSLGFIMHFAKASISHWNEFEVLARKNIL